MDGRLSDPAVQRGPKGTTFAFRAQPGAPRCAIVRDDRGYKVKIDAPPVDGEANERIVRYLSREVFGVPRSAVTWVSGERGRDKVVAVDLSVDEVEAALRRALG